MDEKPTWHEMDNVSWSTRSFGQAHLKEVGLTQNLETMTPQNLKTLNLL